MPQRKSVNLCFTKDGLYNKQDIGYIIRRGIRDVVLFGDGTQEALDQICAFDTSKLGDSVERIGLGKTPLYELRVQGDDGQLSAPVYFYNNKIKVDWVCKEVCAPHFDIQVSLNRTETDDKSAQAPTQVRADKRMKEIICRAALVVWSAILLVEDRYAFPAAAIERLMHWTYYLTPETMQIDTLRELTGFDTLDYNPITDLLSIEIADELYTVGLKTLNAAYGELILPYYRKHFGNKIKIKVSVLGFPNHTPTPMDMSYGALGHLVETMGRACKETMVSQDHPIDPQDLFAMIKQMDINDESCVWVDQSIAQTANQHSGELVRHYHADNGASAVYS